MFRPLDHPFLDSESAKDFIRITPIVSVLIWIMKSDNYRMSQYYIIRAIYEEIIEEIY